MYIVATVFELVEYCSVRNYSFGRDLISSGHSKKNPCFWEGSLTKHQQLAANAILHATSKPKQELLIWAVCGAGKTEMLYPAITEAIRHNKRICLATPRADVVQELYPRLKEVFPNTEMEALYGGTGDRTGVGQLIIATTHQLIRYQNAFDLLIIDELDAFPFHHDPLLHQFAVRSAKKNMPLKFISPQRLAQNKND